MSPDLWPGLLSAPKKPSANHDEQNQNLLPHLSGSLRLQLALGTSGWKDVMISSEPTLFFFFVSTFLCVGSFFQLGLCDSREGPDCSGLHHFNSHCFSLKRALSNQLQQKSQDPLIGPTSISRLFLNQPYLGSWGSSSSQYGLCGRVFVSSIGN